MLRIVKTLSILLPALACAPALAQGPGVTYQFTPLRLADGSAPGLPTGVNASGAIAVSGLFGPSGIVVGGQLTPVDIPDRGVIMGKINGRGDVVGTAYSFFPDFTLAPFIRDKQGTITPLAIPGAAAAFGNGIGDDGTAVGDAYDADGNPLGSYVRDPRGGVSSLNLPGATQTIANGLNARGTIVGFAVDANYNALGFAVTGGDVQAIDVPGVTQVYPSDANDSGQVVGSYYDGAQGHGFLLDRGAVTTLDIPFDGPPTIVLDDITFVLTEVDSTLSGINERGDVVGSVFALYLPTDPDYPFGIAMLDGFVGSRVAPGPKSAVGGAKVAGPLRLRSADMKKDTVVPVGPLKGRRARGAAGASGAAMLVPRR